MAEEKSEKVILEREYIVPLRKKFINTPFYKKTPKAIKALKQFIAKHMKVEERNIYKVKLDKYLNEEVWMGGIRRPPAKIKVKAKKFEDGTVKVELAEIPEFIKLKIEKDKKLLSQKEAKPEEKKEQKEEKPETKEEKPETKEEQKKEEEKKEEAKEKKDAVVESGLKHAEEQARQVKHETKTKMGPKHKVRMALQK